MYKHGAGTERAYRSVAIQRKHRRYNRRTFAKRVIRAPGNLKRAKRVVGWGPAVAQLTEEDPPGTEHRTCKDEDSPHDDDNYERLSDRCIEGVQGSPRPIHPGCGVIR